MYVDRNDRRISMAVLRQATKTHVRIEVLEDREFNPVAFYTKSES
jgi:hypothetical protein